MTSLKEFVDGITHIYGAFHGAYDGQVDVYIKELERHMNKWIHVYEAHPAFDTRQTIISEVLRFLRGETE